MKRHIALNGITDVTKMVQLAMLNDEEISLCSGRYTVDAKSILGVFSLDLTKGVDVEYPDTLADTDFDNYVKNFEI